MKTSEVFINAFYKDSDYSDYEELYLLYWKTELYLAELYNTPYSDIYYQDIDNRRCAICDTPCPTNELGEVTNRCINQRCQAIREFFNMTGPVYSVRLGNYRNPRRAYLRERCKKTFGHPRVWSTPKKKRFVLLLNTMLERMAYESTENNRRLTRNAV